jgi:hypothetical protein
MVSLLLPSMSRELHASPIAVAWVPNGYPAAAVAIAALGAFVIVERCWSPPSARP